jgi:hypothetical protein
MGQDVSTACDGKPPSDIDRLRVIVPDSVRIAIPSVHFSIGQLPDGNPVAKGQHNLPRYAECCLSFFEEHAHHFLHIPASPD